MRRPRWVPLVRLLDTSSAGAEGDGIPDPGSLDAGRSRMQHSKISRTRSADWGRFHPATRTRRAGRLAIPGLFASSLSHRRRVTVGSPLACSGRRRGAGHRVQFAARHPSVARALPHGRALAETPVPLVRRGPNRGAVWRCRCPQSLRDVLGLLRAPRPAAIPERWPKIFM